jgi:ribosomal protein L14E/L6E/L27E
VIGQIAISKRGHDKNNFFIIIAEDDIFCYLVDGKTRLLKKPKKKKLKHVSLTNYVNQEIIDLIDKNFLLDAHIRKAIKKIEVKNKCQEKI